MFISDIFLGFHVYQIVIYATLISISFISFFFKKKNYFVPLSILASVWFYLTTNFTVWLFWDFYTKNFEGLILCYTLAIPFFINTLFSTLIFTFISVIFIKPLEIIPDKIFKLTGLKF